MDYNMNDISVIGIGKLGLCFALTAEQVGYNVFGVDVCSDYVNSINNKNFRSDEIGVDELLLDSSNFKAGIDIEEAINCSDYLFCFVATPSLDNGRYDHSQIDRVVDELISFGVQDQKKHFIIGCTVMPGYCDGVFDKMRDYNYSVSYNPEFIAQGTIIRDQKRPDMVLVGSTDDDSSLFLEKLYDDICENKPKFYRMSCKEAEITKLALNCFITTKISYANMIGDLVDSVGGNPDIVLGAIGSDSRIGYKCLRYGYGYGGPCFPRDNRALAIFSGDNNISATISRASDLSNKEHLEYMVSKYSGSDSVEFDSVTYKPESTIIEESQQLEYAVRLAKNGISVTINERSGVVDSVRKKYGDLFNYVCRE
jgi:UDPglucose 6-dehydrogenase